MLGILATQLPPALRTLAPLILEYLGHRSRCDVCDERQGMAVRRDSDKEWQLWCHVCVAETEPEDTDWHRRISAMTNFPRLVRAMEYGLLIPKLASSLQMTAGSSAAPSLSG